MDHRPRASVPNGTPEDRDEGGRSEAGRALTQRQRILVGSVTGMLVVAAVVMIVFSVRRPSVPEYPLSPPAPAEAGDVLVGPVVYTVDASQASGWTFFDFSRGSVVEDPGPVEWDLAFQRFHIVVNGGEGFAGRGGIRDLGAVPFDSVAAVPETGYVSSEAGRDTVNVATEEWYDYSFTSHLMTAAPRTYAVRTADGRYAKMEILSYYCPGARAGCMTFRYVYQGNGGREVAPGEEPDPMKDPAPVGDETTLGGGSP